MWLPLAAAAPTGSSVNAADGRIRVQLMSRHAVTLSSEIPAKISAIPVVEGGSFRRGQALVEFDCSSYRAQLRKAQASLEAASQLLKVNNQLAKYNSVGTLELTQAQGKAKEAAADASYAQTLVSKCSIAAPFEGRVAKRSAAVHQYVNPGNPILTLSTPTRWSCACWCRQMAGDVEARQPFHGGCGRAGASFPARIERLGAQIDPVSQTILAIGVIDGKAANLLPGMSGWASFK